MNGKSTTSTSPEADDAPRLTREIAERAQIAIGGKVIREAVPPLGRRRGRPPKPDGERKELVSIRLSKDLLEKLRASGEGWQTRVDEVLRRHVEEAARQRTGSARVAEERGDFGEFEDDAT